MQLGIKAMSEVPKGERGLKVGSKARKKKKIVSEKLITLSKKDVFCLLSL